jgi:hypothetical protein
MATYLKGVTDVTPQQPEVKLDYDLLSKSLASLQGRYDSAYKSWKSMYNSLLNAELSSTDNVQFRADYMKKADAALSQVAGVDLANGANLQTAMTIFDPLVNDKEYVRDLYLTKTQRQQLSRMNQLKNSTDPKLQAQYNPIMEQYLGIGMQRLSEMKRGDGSIENATVNMFSPWQDPMEYARNAAKEQGLDIKRITPNGEWMMTEINGPKTFGTFKNWFNNAIGTRFDNQFRIEAEVDVENSVRSKMKETNLDRGTVMKQLAQEYSGTYVKQYNDDMASLQSEINSLNSERKKLEKKYPRPNQQVIDKSNEMKQQKDALQKQFDDMRTAKVDDNQLTQKAAEQFMTNAAGLYVKDVRNRYASQFAYNQAYGKQEVSYAANQIWMHKSSQAHSWAMQKDSQKFQKEMADYNLKADILKMKMKGEIKSSGAEIGQAADVGPVSPYDLYTSTVSENFKKSIGAYTDIKLLAVAANMDLSKQGTVITKSGEPNIKIVADAVSKKANGQALTPEEGFALVSYLNMVSPGRNMNAVDITFSDIQAMITNSVRTNSKLNTEYGASVVASLNEANLARNQYESMYERQNGHLATITDPELTPFIKTDSFGNKSIDNATISKLDADDQELTYRALMGGDYDLYSSKSAKQMNTIVLNPTDPGKFDYSILGAAIANAEKIGATNPLTNEFIAFDENQVAEFRSKTGSGQNMAQAFDPKGTKYQRTVVDGVDYIKVTMPLLRTTGEKSSAVASQFQFIPGGSEAASQNKVEMLVPISKAENLGGTTAMNVNPFTGGLMPETDNLGSMIMDLAGRSLVDRNASWVSNGNLGQGGLMNTNEVSFPLYLQGSVQNGSLSVVNDKIYLQLEGDDNKVNSVDLTELMGIRASDLRANPSAYDYQIRQRVEDLSYRYGRSAMTHSHNQINQNRTSSSGGASWNDVPW